MKRLVMHSDQITDVDTQIPYAQLLDASVGDERSGWFEGAQRGDRVVVGCGAQMSVGGGDEQAARLLASWSQAGWTSFDSQLEDLDERATQAGVSLMIRPNAQGMLSDAICTMNWVRRSQELGCTLLLDPVGWITPSMIRDVDDHLRRFAELCQGCSKVAAVVIRSAKSDGNGGLSQCSLSQGEIHPQIIVDRLMGLATDAQAVVVCDQADLELIGCA